MKSKWGFFVGVLTLIALSAVYAEAPPAPMLPPAPVPAAPLANPFPPSAPAYAPAAPYPAALAPPPRKKLFHGQLRERIRSLFHWCGCP